jgi:hypothetical protein
MVVLRINIEVSYRTSQGAVRSKELATSTPRILNVAFTNLTRLYVFGLCLSASEGF